MDPHSDQPFVAGVAGSARRGGNSDRLLQAALDGARQEGASVEHVVTAKLDISPCRACDACRALGHCIIDSQADRVHKLLRSATAIVVSTPVYFGGVPAQLKALIDRAQVQHWAWQARGAPKPERPALLLVVGGRPYMKSALAAVRTTTAAWLAVLGFRIWSARGYAELDAPSSAQSLPDLVTEVHELGRELTREATSERRAR